MNDKAVADLLKQRFKGRKPSIHHGVIGSHDRGEALHGNEAVLKRQSIHSAFGFAVNAILLQAVLAFKLQSRATA